MKWSCKDGWYSPSGLFTSFPFVKFSQISTGLLSIEEMMDRWTQHIAAWKGQWTTCWSQDVQIEWRKSWSDVQMDYKYLEMFLAFCNPLNTDWLVSILDNPPNMIKRRKQRCPPCPGVPVYSILHSRTISRRLSCSWWKILPGPQSIHSVLYDWTMPWASKQPESVLRVGNSLQRSSVEKKKKQKNRDK